MKLLVAALRELHKRMRSGCVGNLQGDTLSYAELDKRGNQLAHRLARLGVRAEVQVGVMMERSLDLVVALLGVLKAGGAYVPMDPSYPPDRLALMMEDSEARLIGQPDTERLLASRAPHSCLTQDSGCAGARAAEPGEGACARGCADQRSRAAGA